MLDGEVYEDKHEFVTKDCALSCTCVRSRLTCTTSCPVLVGECPKQHKIEFLKVGIEKTSGCRCPQKRRCILGGNGDLKKIIQVTLGGVNIHKSSLLDSLAQLTLARKVPAVLLAQLMNSIIDLILCFRINYRAQIFLELYTWS